MRKQNPPANPLTSSPTGPWKPIAPFRPKIPWEKRQEKSISKVPTPRQQLPLSHPLQKGQGEQRPRGLCPKPGNMGWSQGWS